MSSGFLRGLWVSFRNCPREAWWVIRRLDHFVRNWSKSWLILSLVMLYATAWAVCGLGAKPWWFWGLTMVIAWGLNFSIVFRYARGRR